MQLNLFAATVLRSVELVADSKKMAFYRLKLVFEGGAYSVEKESGGGGKVLDSRAWVFENERAATKFYERKLREKTRPGRKRIYHERHKKVA